MVVVGRSLHIGGWHWLPNIKFGGLVLGCVLRILFNQAGIASRIARTFTGRSLPVVIAAFVYFAMFHARVTIFDPIVCGMALCATLAEPEAFVGRILEYSFLRWVGRLSYSLYIWQQLFLGFGVVYRPFRALSLFPANFAVLFAVSAASYYLMEKPMMRLGHRITRPDRKPQLDPEDQTFVQSSLLELKP
jgi:peptidoglycan/LPS O-acetylase OafA/YrhL